LFLAIVLDAFSRRIVGYAMSSNMRTQLVLDTLNMAIERRRPEGVIHHSDQGTQYTSIAFGSRCREAGVRPSMGSVGDCYDNAMCESFNATLEGELLDRNRFRTHKEADSRSSISSRVGTTGIAATPRSAIVPRLPTSGRRRHEFPISHYPRNPGNFRHYQMRIVIVSDTHLRHDFEIPLGDVLLHCGDSTMDGSTKHLRFVGDWLGSLPHAHKVIIAGNHELTLERFRSFPKRYWPSATYLQDAVVQIQGLKIYGSPWQPEFQDWAFNLPRGPRLARKWAMIPDDTDILVTHGPPWGILDTIDAEGEHLGCEDLLSRVHAIRPKVHAFGHIHGGHGSLESRGTLFVNASICDEEYRPTQRPWVIDVDSAGCRVAEP